jgi:hypothetical protein
LKKGWRAGAMMMMMKRRKIQMISFFVSQFNMEKAFQKSGRNVQTTKPPFVMIISTDSFIAFYANE